MRVRVEHIGNGLHPNEMVVAIETGDGPRRLVVHRKSVIENSLDIGYPISETEDRYLVELPRETVDGKWRVWVPRSAVQADERQRVPA